METVFTFSRHERKNIMKKILATFLLLLTLTAPLFGCDNSDISEASDPQNASDSISDTSNGIAADFEYSVIRDGTISIDKYIGNAAEVVIPDTIDGIPVTLIEISAFSGTPIKKVVIPETVTTIDSSAFEACGHLEKVILPSKLRTLGKNAFSCCESLSFIELPASLEHLGREAFSDCKNLKSLCIPPNCLEAGNNSLFKNSGIETLELSEGIASIPDMCFGNMPALKKLILPTTLKEIGYNAISGCPNLEEIILPEGLETIRSSAFSYSSGLTEITIPKSVRHICSNVFAGCESLEKIIFEGNAPENIWYSDDPEKTEYYHSYKDADHYTIYYHKGAKGFTSPTWYDYPTQEIE